MKLLKNIKPGQKILVTNLSVCSGKKTKKKSKKATMKERQGLNYLFSFRGDKDHLLILRNIKNKSGVIDEPFVHVDIQDIYSWDNDKKELGYEISYTIIQKI